MKAKLAAECAKGIQARKMANAAKSAEQQQKKRKAAEEQKKAVAARKEQQQLEKEEKKSSSVTARKNVQNRSSRGTKGLVRKRVVGKTHLGEPLEELADDYDEDVMNKGESDEDEETTSSLEGEDEEDAEE